MAICGSAVLIISGLLPQTLRAHPPEDTKPALVQPCGTFYAKSQAFMICAPKGWKLDDRVLNDEGIYAVFYPAGSSWTKAMEAGSVMYVHPSPRGTGQDPLSEFMKEDAERTAKQAPSVKVKELERITTADGDARVQQFEHSANDRFEAVAYLDSPETLIVFAITSKDQMSFRRDYPAFADLVGSYRFLTAQVPSSPDK